jgi:hypothetical protein
MVRILGLSAALALFSAAMWFAWLGWDHEYYLVDGYPQGPYRAWQVIGCGASIAVAAVAAYLLVRRIAAIFTLAPAAVLGFAIAWGQDAATTDDSGLWVIGLGMILVGGTGALLALLAVTAAVAGTRGRPNETRAP